MRTRIRLQQILIDMPKDGEEIWVHVTIERMVYSDDYILQSTSPRGEFIHKEMTHFGQDIFNYDDEELDPEITKEISGFGINRAISNAIATWIAEKFNIVMDENRMIWLL